MLTATLPVLAAGYQATSPLPSLDQIATIAGQIVEHAPTGCKVLLVGVYVGLMVLCWREGQRRHAILYGIAAVGSGVVAASSAFAY